VRAGPVGNFATVPSYVGAIRTFASMPRRLRVPFIVVALAGLTLIVAGSVAAKNPPKNPSKSPNDSAIAQYVETVPGAGGAKPSSPAGPVSAAFAPSGGGMGSGTVLVIVLGGIALAGTGAYVVRRRLGRQ
jgi:hypothetical protein